MLNTQTTQTTPVKFLGVEERLPLMADPPHRNRITKKMDTTILDRVDEALWNDEVLRTDYKEIDLYVEDQIVYLSGYVVSTSNQQRVERAINHIPGILGIKNSLFLDDNLTREIAGALGQIEHTTKPKFFTGVRHGVVTLNGEVNDVNVRSQAEITAASVPGVRGVLNHIRAPGFVPKPEDLHFLQPAIGTQIYFRDDPSGIVKQVIINPNNRLVVAMVVEGHFSKSRQPFQSGMDRGASSAKKVVVPIREIRFLTKRSGFLNIKSVETTRFGSFFPKSYIAPKKDWTPPFPYYLEDVLFPAEYGEAVQTQDEKTFSESLDAPMETSLLREQALSV